MDPRDQYTCKGYSSVPATDDTWEICVTEIAASSDSFTHTQMINSAPQRELIDQFPMAPMHSDIVLCNIRQNGSIGKGMAASSVTSIAALRQLSNTVTELFQLLMEDVDHN